MGLSTWERQSPQRNNQSLEYSKTPTWSWRFPILPGGPIMSLELPRTLPHYPSPPQTRNGLKQTSPAILAGEVTETLRPSS